MERPAPLPLSLDALPEAARRFCDPAAPLPARTMAARGLVPLRGPELVTVLAQLCADAEPAVASAAASTLESLPENVLASSVEGPLHPSVLDALAVRFTTIELRERIAGNAATDDGTVAWLAREADERLGERIAANEARLLRAPAIIGALYNNRRVRMSTADRLVELAGRHGIDVPGIPKETLQAHVEAIAGEPVFEPTDERLPDDVEFTGTVAADSDDPDAVEIDEVKEEERVREQHLPLLMAIARLSKAKKLRLAQMGSAAARAILMRDKDKQIAMAAVRSPQLTMPEAVAAAQSRQVSEDILRYVGTQRTLTRSMEVKRALVFNPKTPFGITLGFLSHLHTNDLRDLSRSRNVAPQLKSAALQKIAAKEKREK
jgi:hypothetical protein